MLNNLVATNQSALDNPRVGDRWSEMTVGGFLVVGVHGEDVLILPRPALEDTKLTSVTLVSKAELNTLVRYNNSPTEKFCLDVTRNVDLSISNGIYGTLLEVYATFLQEYQLKSVLASTDFMEKYISDLRADAEYRHTLFINSDARFKFFMPKIIGYKELIIKHLTTECASLLEDEKVGDLEYPYPSNPKEEHLFTVESHPENETWFLVEITDIPDPIPKGSDILIIGGVVLVSEHDIYAYFEEALSTDSKFFINSEALEKIDMMNSTLLDTLDSLYLKPELKYNGRSYSPFKINSSCR